MAIAMRIFLFVIIIVMLYLVIKLIFTPKKKIDDSKIDRSINKTKSISDELLKLQNLLEEGIINEEEFEKLKKKLLE